MCKADEPAFPHMGTYGIDGVTGPNYGLTKREYFAAKAIAPVGDRPCDCKRCDCGNADDMISVALYDSMKDAAAEILSLAERKPE